MNHDDEEQDYDEVKFYFLFDLPPTPPLEAHTCIHIDWDRAQCAQQLFDDHFASNARYKSKFKCRFQMSKELCLRIVKHIQSYDLFWVQKPDACGVMGHTVYHKVVCALEQLTLGVPADATNDYVGIGDTAAILILRLFMKHINEIYGPD